MTDPAGGVLDNQQPPWNNCVAKEVVYLQLLT